jgi:HD-GYP domain-containing protein (c-di-GMP phosphodiesterase class II)
MLLARELRLSAAERIILLIGARLHDIGKLALADGALHMPVPLTDDERAEIQAHPVLGCHMISAMPMLAPMMPIIRSHHERWDGAGYPDRLAGTAIPLLARVVAVADAYDAMTSDRPYRSALSPDEAREQIRAGTGSQFDPDLAATFLRMSSRHTSRPRERIRLRRTPPCESQPKMPKWLSMRITARRAATSPCLDGPLRMRA